MFERFTEDLRVALIEARRAAGPILVSNGHLLFGLLTAKSQASAALARFDIDPADLHRRLAPVRSSAPDPAPVARPGNALGPDARSTFEQSLRESIALGHSSIQPLHLLLALTHNDPDLFAGLGVDAAAVRAAALGLAPAGDPVHLPRLGPPPPRASGAARAGRYAITIGIFAVICALIAVTTGPDGITTALLAAFFMAIAFVLLPLVTRLARRRVIARFRGRPPAPTIPAAELAGSLAGWGVSDLTVYGPAVPGRRANAAAGLGRIGIIRVWSGTMNSPAGPFVLAHEAAHVGRRDGRHITLASLTSLYLVGAGILSLDLAVVVACVLGATVFLVSARWRAEFGADRVAAQWVGRDATEAGLAYLARLRDLSRRNSRRGLVLSLLSWRSHPPLRLRRWFALR